LNPSALALALAQSNLVFKRAPLRVPPPDSPFRWNLLVPIKEPNGKWRRAPDCPDDRTPESKPALAGCRGERGHDAPPDPKAWREHSNRGRRENYDRRGQRESREAGDRRAPEREGPSRRDLRAHPAGEPSGASAQGGWRGRTGGRKLGGRSESHAGERRNAGRGKSGSRGSRSGEEALRTPALANDGRA